MALLKPANQSPLAREAIALDLGDLARQGRAIVDAARAEAERIAQAAREERERLVRGGADEGRAKGFAQGLEEGRQAGMTEGRAAGLAERQSDLARLEAGLTNLLDTLAAERQAMADEARAGLLKLAVAIGERIARRTIAVDPAACRDAVAEAMALVMRPSRVRVLVNPLDAALVREALPGLASRFAAVEHAELVEDDTVERGGCVAELRGGVGGGGGDGGIIDATIATKVARISEALVPGALRVTAQPGSLGIGHEGAAP
jgi:flagellar biosynthesis/type III secretory pathway protein FliH